MSCSTARCNNGWTIGQRGESPRGPFVYFLNEGHPGTVIEMAELTPDAAAHLRRGPRGRDRLGRQATRSVTTGRPGDQAPGSSRISSQPSGVTVAASPGRSNTVVIARFDDGRPGDRLRRAPARRNRRPASVTQSSR